MASFTAGTTFVDGVSNDVTAAKLGALVTNATPTSGFIQDRTAETITATNDTLLIGDASDSNNLKRITVANFAQTLPTVKVTTGTIETGTFGTTTSTAATITTGTIPTLVATTLITTGTGTAAAPAIVPTGDTNTGIFFPAADTIAFSEGGAEAMRIDSSGNVGIGITPSQKLDVNGGSAIRGTLFLGDGSSSVIRKLTSSTPLTFANQGGSAEMTIDSSGNLLVGGTNTEPAGNSTSGVAIKPPATSSNGMVEICNANLTALVLGSTTGDATLARFRRAGAAVGSISVTAGATAFVTSSDYRLKTNLEPISNAIERIKQLPVYRFNWIADESGNKVDGFVAHEAQSIVPEAILGTKDEVDSEGKPIYQGIDQSKIVPLLTAALKEAIAKIETLEAKVTALEAA